MRLEMAEEDVAHGENTEDHRDVKPRSVYVPHDGA
jgi:hypothetical protein